MTRLIFSPTQGSERPICTHCGQRVLAGEAIIVGNSAVGERSRHEACPCPSCGKDRRGSEQWSTEQCDDCFVTGPDDVVRHE